MKSEITVALAIVVLLAMACQANAEENLFILPQSILEL
jgi:hypothetical protein